MPKRTDIESILIIGAGPIVIGQACEFDYSGAQACKALQGGGLPRHPGELESRDDHDRPGDGRCDLHRAGQLAHRRAHHREGAPERAAADDGRTDGAQLRARSGARRRAGEVRRRADRRLARGDRHGGGSRALPQRHARDRPGVAALAHRAQHGRGAGACRPRSASRPSSARRSRWAAPAAASPTTARSSRRSSSAASTPRRPAKCCSKSRCSAGKSSRWRWCATARTTASSSARSRTSIRWACTPAIRSRSRRRRR